MNRSNFCLLIIIITILAIAVVHDVNGECWDTGCQQDTWLVKGCEQYLGMTEIKREPCKNGHVYSCCYQKNSIDPSQRLCWATKCHLNSWPIKGCQQYNMIEVERSPCDQGYVYFCCNSTENYYSYYNKVSSLMIKLNKTGDLTHYSLGLTACGQVYTDQDMVAAIAFDYFTSPNPNVDPICGRQAKIIDPTTLKYIVVAIRDKCENCKKNDIDVSSTAFKKLKPLTVGRFKVLWDFI